MASQQFEQRDITGEDHINLYEVLGDQKLVDYLMYSEGIYSAIVDEQFAVWWTVIPNLMVRRQMVVRLYEGKGDINNTTRLLEQEVKTWKAQMLSLHGLRPAQ